MQQAGAELVSHYKEKSFYGLCGDHKKTFLPF
jgi:hypothetical protein